MKEETENESREMTPEEKKKELFLRQKQLLVMFAERNAITKQQYGKSLGDLMDKMGFGEDDTD